MSDVLDFFRQRERESWVAFEAAPSIDTRRQHFQDLTTLLRELDARAEQLLLKNPAVQMSGRKVT